MKLTMHNGCDYATLEEHTILPFRECTAVIPKGFRFDGASIPRIAWTILGLHPWHPRVRRAALFHDYMYSKGFKLMADRGFKHFLKLDGCTRFQYMACYLAVKLFGSRHVNRSIGNV